MAILASRPLQDVPTSELLARLRMLEDRDAPWEESADLRRELGRRPLYDTLMAGNAERARRREVLELDGTA